LGPLPKFGTGKARNFKFGIRINLGKSHLTDEKYLAGAWSGYRADFFLNFGILPKFRTGEAIDISNLVHRSIVAITVQWMINSPKVVIVT